MPASWVLVGPLCALLALLSVVLLLACRGWRE
jgi:hypothetical protein